MEKEDSSSKLKGAAWLGAACLIGVVCALGLSPLAHAVPWSWEKKMAHALEFTPPYQECRYNPQAEELLRRMVARLYPVKTDDKDFSIEVQVVKDTAVNAYASLGGNIHLNSGLLQQAKTPEEVAGVLAHEIEHVHHRHIMEGAMNHLFTAEGINLIFGTGTSAASWARFFLNMDFTKRQETQADKDGLKRLQAAHIDNHGFRDFFERMDKSDSSFLSDHPSSRSRMEMASTFENKDTLPIMSPAEWEILRKDCSEK